MSDLPQFHRLNVMVILRIVRGLDSTGRMPVPPKRPKIVPILGAISVMIFLASCADVRQELTARAQQLPDLFSGATTSEGFWRGDGARGPAKIVVHVGEQRAYF